MTTRRTLLLAGLAAVPLAPVHALADASDPIYAAIEAHRVALAERDAASEARDVVERPLLKAHPQGGMDHEEWDRRMRDDPAFRASVNGSMAASAPRKLPSERCWRPCRPRKRDA